MSSRTLRQGRASADSLVSLGALGAYGYSVYAVLTGAEAVYFDTVTMVLVIFTLGRFTSVRDSSMTMSTDAAGNSAPKALRVGTRMRGA